MAGSINDLQRAYFIQALGLDSDVSDSMSLADLAYAFFSNPPGGATPLILALPTDVGTTGQVLKAGAGGTITWQADANTAPATLTKAQAEAIAGTTPAGLVTGQRLSEAAIANLKALPGYAVGSILTATATSAEWTIPSP